MTAISSGNSSIRESAISRKAPVKSSIKLIKSILFIVPISSVPIPTLARRDVLNFLRTESRNVSITTPLAPSLPISSIKLFASFLINSEMNLSESKAFLLKRNSSRNSFVSSASSATSCSKIFIPSRKDPSDASAIIFKVPSSIFIFSPRTTLLSDLTISSGFAFLKGI